MIWQIIVSVGVIAVLAICAREIMVLRRGRKYSFFVFSEDDC